MDSLLGRYVYREDVSYGLIPVATMFYGVDEAYHNERTNKMLIRKGNEIYLLDAYEIDFWSEENVEVLKALFR